jgi:hypothetical protein
VNLYLGWVSVLWKDVEFSNSSLDAEESSAWMTSLRTIGTWERMFPSLASIMWIEKTSEKYGR